MSLTVDQIKKLFFSSQYEMDKVLDVFQDSFSISASGSEFSPVYANHSFAHGLGGLALPLLIFSTDNVSWYPAGSSPIVTRSGFPTDQSTEATAYCTATDVVIMANNWTLTSKTIYYAVAMVSIT